MAQFDFYMQVQQHYTAHNTSATVEFRDDEIESLTDGASLSDSAVIGFGSNQSDALSLAESLTLTSGLAPSDSVSVSEVLSKDSSKTFADNISVVELLVLNTSRSLSDSTTISESINVQLVAGATASSVVNASALNTFALNI
jgi:hypothetical protein